MRMDFSAIPADAPLPRLDFRFVPAKPAPFELSDSDGKNVRKITDTETIQKFHDALRETSIPIGLEFLVSSKDATFAIHYLVALFDPLLKGFENTQRHECSQIVANRRFNLREEANLAAHRGVIPARKCSAGWSARVMDFAVWFGETQELADRHWVKQLMTFFYIYRRATVPAIASQLAAHEQIKVATPEALMAAPAPQDPRVVIPGFPTRYIMSEAARVRYFAEPWPALITQVIREVEESYQWHQIRELSANNIQPNVINDAIVDRMTEAEEKRLTHRADAIELGKILVIEMNTRSLDCAVLLRFLKTFDGQYDRSSGIWPETAAALQVVALNPTCEAPARSIDAAPIQAAAPVLTEGTAEQSFSKDWHGWAFELAKEYVGDGRYVKNGKVNMSDLAKAVLAGMKGKAHFQNNKVEADTIRKFLTKHRKNLEAHARKTAAGHRQEA